MKKLISILLVIALFAALTACSSGDTSQPTTQTKPSTQTEPTTAPTEPTTAPTEPTKVKLTPENISEYLLFTHKTADIIKEDTSSSFYHKYAGNLTLASSPKKRGSFEGVTLSFIFQSRNGWGNERMVVQIPLDGKTEACAVIHSDYFRDNPNFPVFTVSVESVTGYFIPG